MNMSLVKPVRVLRELNESQLVRRDIDRAQGILDAAIARAYAEYNARVKDTVEKHLGKDEAEITTNGTPAEATNGAPTAPQEATT